MDTTDVRTMIGEFLHDAILKSVHIAWGEAEALISLESAEHPSRLVHIKVKGLHSVHCPRLEPWGKGGSVSVNEMRQYELANGTRIVIETQSGDRIQIDADSIEFNVLEGE